MPNADRLVVLPVYNITTRSVGHGMRPGERAAQKNSEKRKHRNSIRKHAQRVAPTQTAVMLAVMLAVIRCKCYAYMAAAQAGSGARDAVSGLWSLSRLCRETHGCG